MVNQENETRMRLRRLEAMKDEIKMDLSEYSFGAQSIEARPEREVMKSIDFAIAHIKREQAKR